MSVLRIRKLGATAWNNVPDPKSLQWSIQDMDSEDGSGRNQKGEMFRDRVGTKRKLTCEWPPMKDADISALLLLITDTFFEVEYPDAQEGARKVSIMYVGDRSAPMYHYYPDTGAWLWESMSANFVEK